MTAIKCTFELDLANEYIGWHAPVHLQTQSLPVDEVPTRL